MWLDTVLLQRTQHVVHEVCPRELLDRDIDGHGKLAHAHAFPGRQLPARLVDDPVADGNDQAGFLGHGNEDVRADPAALGMGPTQQCLHADDPARRQVQLWLVVKLQAVALEGALQLGLQLEATERANRHRLTVKSVRIASAILGLVHGHVRLDEQVFDIRTITRTQRNTDAGRDHEPMTVAVKRFGQRTADAIGDDDRLLFVVQPGEQHHELIAAKACNPVTRVPGRGALLRDAVGGSDALLQPARDFLQQRVTDGMAEVVVDALEAVEVKVEQGHQLIHLPGLRERARRLAHKQLAVGQARQRVVVGKVFNACLGLAPLGGIANHDQQRPIGLWAHPGFEPVPHLAVANLELDAGRFRRGLSVQGLAGRARHYRRKHFLQRLADQIATIIALIARDVLYQHAVAVHHEDRIGQCLQQRTVAALALPECVQVVESPQHEPDAMRKGRPEHGLVDEVGRPGVIGTGDGFRVVMTRDHDDRHIAAGGQAAQRRADIESIATGKVDVEQGQIGFVLLERAHRLLGVTGDAGIKGRLLQGLAGQQGKYRIIVNDQYAAARLFREPDHTLCGRRRLRRS